MFPLFTSVLRCTRILVLAFTLGVLGVPAHAQGLPGSNPLSSTATQGLFKAMSQQLTTPGTAVTGAPQPLALSAFRSTTGRMLPARMAAAMAHLKSGEQEQIEALYVELLDGYDRLLEENGETRLRNNVAGAVTYALMIGHYVLSGEELTPPQQEGLLDTVNQALAAIPAFNTMTDARKQELYEALILNASMALALHQEGAQDPDSETDAQDLAQTLFRLLLGRDHGSVEFTPAGLRLN